MKKYALFLLAVILHLTASGQGYRYSEVAYLHNMGKLGEPQLERENVEGSPFVFKDWPKGEILTADKRRILVKEINYNARQNKFFYKIGEDYYELYPHQVDFVIVRTGKKDHIFVPQVPYPFPKPYNGFVEIFTTDRNKIYAVKIHRKTLEPANKSQSYASDRSFEKMKYYDKSRFYILKNGMYVKAPTSVSKLAKLLELNNKQAKELKKFVKTNKLSLKNGADLQKIMEYYYSHFKAAK